MGKAHETRRHGKGAIICLQGEVADCLYILKRGRIGVYINAEKEQPTAEEVTRSGVMVGCVKEPGNFIGEGGMFLARRRASLVSLAGDTETECIPLRTGGLRQVMLGQPVIGLKLCRSQAERLREVTGRVRDVCAVAESVSRAVDRFSLDFAVLLGEVEERSQLSLDLRRVLESFERNSILARGRELMRQRRDTTMFFAHAAREQRSGQRRLRPGEVLMEEGKLGRALFLVHRGELRVTVGRLAVGYVGAGEIVGEVAVLLKELPKRSATVTAVSEVLLDAVPAVRFHALALERPAILVALAQTLATRLDTTNRLVCQRSRRSAGVLDVLAGGSDSCAGQFRRLGDELRRVEEGRALADRARDLAEEAESIRAQLEENLASMREPRQ